MDDATIRAKRKELDGLFNETSRLERDRISQLEMQLQQMLLQIDVFKKTYELNVKVHELTMEQFDLTFPMKDAANG